MQFLQFPAIDVDPHLAVGHVDQLEQRRETQVLLAVQPDLGDVAVELQHVVAAGLAESVVVEVALVGANQLAGVERDRQGVAVVHGNRAGLFRAVEVGGPDTHQTTEGELIAGQREPP